MSTSTGYEPNRLAPALADEPRTSRNTPVPGPPTVYTPLAGRTSARRNLAQMVPVPDDDLDAEISMLSVDDFIMGPSPSALSGSAATQHFTVERPNATRVAVSPTAPTQVEQVLRDEVEQLRSTLAGTENYANEVFPRSCAE